MGGCSWGVRADACARWMLAVNREDGRKCAYAAVRAEGPSRGQIPPEAMLHAVGFFTGDKSFRF